MAGSVSNEHVWQKWIETTLFTTPSIVFCHSAVSCTAPATGTMGMASRLTSLRASSTSISGVGDAATPLRLWASVSALICFIGRSLLGVGGCLRLLWAPFCSMGEEVLKDLEVV